MLDQTCSRVHLADLLDLSEQRVGVLTKTGILSRGPKGYDVRTAVRSYLAFLRSQPKSLTNERARLAKVQADLGELKLKERTNELVKRSAVQLAVFNRNRQTRDNLKNIASRISGMVCAESSQDQCFRIIDQEITQALEGLANDTTPPHA